MALYKWVRELVTKYTFITRTKFFLLNFYIYYEKDGVEKYKRIPYRAEKEQLIRTIDKIKKDINYTEEKQKRDTIVKKEIKHDEKNKPIFITS